VDARYVESGRIVVKVENRWEDLYRLREKCCDEEEERIIMMQLWRDTTREGDITEAVLLKSN
jgi:hypothetical protein